MLWFPICGEWANLANASLIIDPSMFAKGLIIDTTYAFMDTNALLPVTLHLQNATLTRLCRLNLGFNIIYTLSVMVSFLAR